MTRISALSAGPCGSPIISFHGITKTFPGVIANNDVSIDFHGGEIHALLGENGAGKSTLMNMLSGISQPDSGEIRLEGKRVDLRSAAQAISLGIGMVHQHFKLVKAFTVAENVHLGRRDLPRHLTQTELIRRTAALAEQFALSVKPDALVRDLSAGEQQRVEILRVLARGAKVLILDEPTAVLTPQEARDLFRSVRTLRDAGSTIIFISHKLDEVIEIADRLTVLRRGAVVASQPNARLSSRDLANLMVGRDVLFQRQPRAAAGAEIVLQVQGLCALDDRKNPALRDISLQVRAGEILGIGGVAGNGQRELAEALTGLRPVTSGTIRIGGNDLTGAPPLSFQRAGIGHIPEDRLRSGFAGALSIAYNSILREYRKPPVGGRALFSRSGANHLAGQIVEEARVTIPSLAAKLGGLSGGNQQRLIAAREARIAQRLMIAVYPTRGLDVGAIERLREMMLRLREEGVAIILISEDLDELVQVADRIAVLFHGRIAGEADPETTTREALGLLMGGKSAAGESAHD